MAGYTSTVTAKCWKQHTCLLCGAVYRYKIERKRQAQASTIPVAQQRASAAVQKALEKEYDKRPCPHCGLLQPEMIGQSKRSTHGCLMSLTVLLAGVLAILTGTDALGIKSILYIAVGVAGLLALLHISAALNNPNVSLERNLSSAAGSTSAGVTQLIQPGAADKPASVPMSQSGVGLAFVLLLSGLVLLGLAEIKRSTSGWAYNDRWYPPVAGPGDTARFYFGQSISSVKGYWNANSATASAANSAELGLTPSDVFVGTSKKDSWGSRISAKNSEKTSSSSLYMDVTMPRNPKLQGETAQMNMDLTVTYPAMSGSGFTEQKSKVSRSAPITFAAPEAGKQYMKFWWWGLMGGLFLEFVAGWMLLRKAKRLMNGLPTQLIPIEEAPATAQPAETKDGEA
jgi:hypothetical protein